jgi:hypothetical protein
MLSRLQLKAKQVTTTTAAAAALVAVKPFFGLGRFFSFLILYTVDRTLPTGDQPVARPLPKQRSI